MGRAYHGYDQLSDRQKKLYKIIFEAETPAGKRFDVVLLWLILFSVVVVLLESVSFIREGRVIIFRVVEWIITLLFTIEYALRIYCTARPWRYIRSFYGIIDLLAILPTFIGIIFPAAHSLMTIRAMRLLRVFRILKLERFMSESRHMIGALRHSGVKILVFLFGVLTVVIIFGTIMFLVEGSESGFSSIPQSIYWAIVTLTTVGYGDIVPVTPFGRILATIVMILGYGIIAVPTGIVSSEMSRAQTIEDNKDKPDFKRFRCPECKSEDHLADARYCQHCGIPFSDISDNKED